MARKPYLDACPQCGTRNNAPQHVQPSPVEGVSAFYRCGKCRHVWQTGWQRISKES